MLNYILKIYLSQSIYTLVKQRKVIDRKQREQEIAPWDRQAPTWHRLKMAEVGYLEIGEVG